MLRNGRDSGKKTLPTVPPKGLRDAPARITTSLVVLQNDSQGPVTPVRVEGYSIPSISCCKMNEMVTKKNTAQKVEVKCLRDAPTRLTGLHGGAIE